MGKIHGACFVERDNNSFSRAIWGERISSTRLAPKERSGGVPADLEGAVSTSTVTVTEFTVIPILVPRGRVGHSHGVRVGNCS